MQSTSKVLKWSHNETYLNWWIGQTFELVSLYNAILEQIFQDLYPLDNTKVTQIQQCSQLMLRRWSYLFIISFIFLFVSVLFSRQFIFQSYENYPRNADIVWQMLHQNYIVKLIQFILGISHMETKSRK